MGIPGYAKIEYKVSGKVVYDGKGVTGIRIGASSTQVLRGVYTNELGEFHLYLPQGIHKLSITRQNDFLNTKKVITVTNKNISNVIFVLEKGCTVTGTVTCEDGSRLYGSVIVRNKRGGRRPGTGQIKENGQYIAEAIPAASDTYIMVEVFGMPLKYVEGYVLEEGQTLNIDFVYPAKKRVVYGKVLDKLTKEPVKLEDGLSVTIFNNKTGLEAAGCNALLNQNGEFFIYNFAPGKYTISASSYIHKDALIDITLVENEEKYLIIELEREPEAEKQ
jgi:hypothetical protein